MPTKDPLVYGMHIRDCCRRIAEYTATGGADWPASALIMDAVCRNITIIGEAARRLDEPFRRAHPETPWSSLLGARNIVMHDYEYLHFFFQAEDGIRDYKVTEVQTCALPI